MDNILYSYLVNCIICKDSNNELQLETKIKDKLKNMSPSQKKVFVEAIQGKCNVPDKFIINNKTYIDTKDVFVKDNN